MTVDKIECISQCIHRLLLLCKGMTVSVKTPTQQNEGTFISPGIISCDGDCSILSRENSGLICKSPLGSCWKEGWWKGKEAGIFGCVNVAGNPEMFDGLD